MFEKLLIIVLLIIGLFIITNLIAFKSVDEALAYYKNMRSKGAREGIFQFIVVVCLLFLTIESALGAEKKDKWFNYLEVWGGVDYTFKPSPICKSEGPNDRLTSDGGIRLNLYTFGNGWLETNGVYRHKSCQWNGDNSFDALGAEIKMRWEF